MRLRILTDLFHLFLTKNLSPDSLADLYGIALEMHKVFLRKTAFFRRKISGRILAANLCDIALDSLWRPGIIEV